jgi:hypothetical protein
MTFFYDLNKRLADLAKKQDQRLAESTQAVETATKSKLAESLAVAEAGYSAKAGRAGKDLGKPGKNFAKIAAKSGGGEKGQRIAGAVLNKLRHPKESTGMTDEGNAFSGAVAKAKANGIQPGEKINVGGKTYPVKEAGKPMTPKQKSFAKLAPPTDKITFADKIAGAKKEVDEMLGDVAAEAIKGAIGKKSEPRSKGTAFDADFMKQQQAKKDAESHSRYNVQDTGYSKRYTRKVQDEPTDDAETSAAPRGRGRPKGAPKGPERTTSKAWKHKGTRVAEEGEEHVCEMCGQPTVKEGEHMGRPAKYGVCVVGHNDGKPVKTFDTEAEAEAYANKGVRIGGKLLQGSVRTIVGEKAKSKAQQKFMGMVHATQKGEKAPSKEVAKVAKDMPKKAAKDFAATKHKGLPNKVKEESTDKEDQRAEKAGKKVAKDIEYDEGHKSKGDNKAEKAGKKVTKDIEYDDKKDKKEKKVSETSTGGSGSMQFGKGVYEGLNSKLEQMISESITVESKMEEGLEGQTPSITIQASGDEAAKLMMLLKLAGLEGQAPSTCPTCGSAECGCDAEVVDENQPDWPTNTETIDADPELRTYSGGLDGPKSTGQSTIPVLASQARRQTSMEESVKIERSLFSLYKNFKG